MNTKKIPLLILSCLVLAGCGSAPENLSREREVVVSSVETKKVSALTEAEYKDIPMYLGTRLVHLKSYQAVTKGKTTATFLFIPVDQTIDVTTIKGKEYSYMKNESHSAFVNTTHLAYYHGDHIVVKDNGAGEFTQFDKKTYLEKYGVDPFGYTIEGFSLNEDAIKAVTKEESAEHYKFKIEFDTEKATNNMKIQMRQFGGLDDYPSFSYCSATLTLQDDFTPVSIDIESYYKAKKGAETDCHQTYTVTYSAIDQDTPIPDLDTVKSETSF